MKKSFKKFGVIVLALAMVFALTAVAFAADDTYKGSGNDNADNFAGLSSNPQTIPLTKGIVFFNANSSNVYEPTISFVYTVAPAVIAADGSDASVTDGSTPPVTRKVYPGPADGVNGVTISFAPGTTTVETLADGKEVEETGNLELDISKFSKPGIYRYVITEKVGTSGTDADNLAAAGLAARNTGYISTRYLDVYIRYNTSGSLEMYGAVIFKTTESTGNEGKDDIDTTTEKTTGFEPGDNSDPSYSYESDATVDKYYTYDFTVKKTVSGSLADKNNEFPFYVTVSNSISGAVFTYTKDGTETFTGANVADSVVTLTAADFSIGSDALTSNLKLKDGDTIKLVGVPSNQTNPLAVVVKEFNNTYDEYTASAANPGTLAIAETNGDSSNTTGVMTASTGTVKTASFNVVTNDAANQILTIDNALTEISVTGVTLRVAPFAAMAGAGIVFLAVSKKSKKEEEDA